MIHNVAADWPDVGPALCMPIAIQTGRYAVDRTVVKTATRRAADAR
jgi:hypothetical protein